MNVYRNLATDWPTFITKLSLILGLFSQIINGERSVTYITKTNSVQIDLLHKKRVKYIKIKTHTCSVFIVTGAIFDARDDHAPTFFRSETEDGPIIKC